MSSADNNSYMIEMSRSIVDNNSTVEHDNDVDDADEVVFVPNSGRQIPDELSPIVVCGQVEFQSPTSNYDCSEKLDCFIKHRESFFNINKMV